MGIEREKLIKIINRALRTEEEAVPALTQYISAAINFIERDEKTRAKIIAIMEQLARESNGHAIILKDLLEIIDREKKDVY